MDWGVETERRLLAFIRDFGEERVCQELRNAQLYEEQTRRRVGNVVRFIEEALKKTKKKHGAADGRSPLDVLNRGYREDGTHWSVGETPPEAGAKPCLYDPGWWLLPDGKHGTDGRNVSIMSSKTETYPLAA